MLSSVTLCLPRGSSPLRPQIHLAMFQNHLYIPCFLYASSNTLHGSGMQRKNDSVLKANLWDYMSSSLSKINLPPVMEPLPDTKVNDMMVENVEEEEFGSEEIFLTECEQENDILEKIVYICGKEVDVDELQSLCAKVGWPKRPTPKISTALKNSYMVATLYSVKQSLKTGDEVQRSLIGMARATSDHVFNATIWDVVVDPLYQVKKCLQGRGLGKALLEQMIQGLLKRDITNITLFSDSQVVGFYQNLGFEPDAGGVRGMFWYPKL